MSNPAASERSIFLAAIEKESPAERAAYLAEACGGDTSLRAEVEALLAAHGRLGEMPAESEATVDESTQEGPGTVIGLYKLMEQIGEGGMGLVYVAEQQQPIRRKVAIKVIKPGMDTRAVIGRFEAERQALALMDHPNIAKVLDGGETATGRPYFVMELVKGIPITQFCDDHRLSTRERLELFLSVCQAVQHAHQKGIIHRDIKPTNVLVMSHDGEPVVRVIDFGVAKAIGQQLTDKTVYTQFTQLIGTPLYMAPEQAGQSGLDVDTRSDIYSLGVLLYELLTGTTPFQKERFKEADYDQIRRIIREEEPPKPSTRMSTLGQATTTASERRRSNPRKLSRLFRGELDWIVMKALEKDRNRRYETASAFAADVQRYLSDEPVQACPPSVSYRFRKFARRNKAALTMSAVIALALLTGVVALAVSEVRVRAETEAKLGAERERGDEAAKRADEEGKRRGEESKRADAEKARAQFADALRAALAFHQWRDYNVRGADALLDRCEPASRLWEWHYVKRLCHGDLSTVRLPGDDQHRYQVALSPDARRVALKHPNEGMVHLYDAATAAETGRVTFTYRIFDIAFSADGNRLALAGKMPDRNERGLIVGWRAAVSVRDANSGNELIVLKGPAVPVEPGQPMAVGLLEMGAAAFSPDGKAIAAVDHRGNLFVWDSAGKERFHTVAHQPTPNPKTNEVWFTSVSFSPDSRQVVTADMEDKLVKIWDIEKGNCAQTLAGGEEFWGAVFSPKGKWVAAMVRYQAGWPSTFDLVCVWDAKTGRVHRLFRGRWCYSLAFNPDESRLIVGSQDSFTNWDLATGKEVGTYRSSTGVVGNIVFSPDGQRITTATWGGFVQTWDVRRAPEATLIACPNSWQATFSPDGRHIAACCFFPKYKSNRVGVWDAVTGEEVTTYGDDVLAQWGVTYSPDGKHLAAAVHEKSLGRVKIWDATTGKLDRVFPDENAAPIAALFKVAYSPDGKLLAAGGGDRIVRVWEIATGKELFQLGGHTRTITGLAFSGDGRRLATATGGLNWGPGPNPLNLKGDDFKAIPDLKIWDVATGKELRSWNLPEKKAPGLAISPDGEVVAAPFTDNVVRLFSVATGEEVAVLKGHTGMPQCVAFSPDGRRLVTGGDDDAVKVWDAKTGEETFSVGQHVGGMILSVAFSPDGHKIVSTNLNDTKVWDATPLKK
jgi:WD40 repeat protein/serine/threonine protein kinase